MYKDNKSKQKKQENYVKKIVLNIVDICPQYCGYSSTMLWIFVLNVGDNF